MKSILLNKGMVALVDDDDYEIINQKKWRVAKNSKTFYAARYENKERVHMHRFIMNPPRDFFIDHIDGNGLNNQKSNLRVCSKTENNRNKSLQKNSMTGYKGVSKSGKNFRVRIMVNGAYIGLGSYTDPKVAAQAFDKAAKKYFGNFAKLNFP